MVQYSRRSLDLVFSALGDPIRRAMLEQLARGETSISRLAGPHRISLTAVRKHVRVLERAGLVADEKRGRVRHVRLAREHRRGRARRLNLPPLLTAREWIVRFASLWDGHLQRLKAQVEADL